MPNGVRVRLRAVGRVQGVGYRRFVERTAQSLGLSGWVRNADDGSVELEAEGELTAINALRDALRRGPPAARVQSLDELTPHPASPLPRPFAVRY